jgi:glycosyltransferase involved in cell wall biosynthesis
MNKSLITVIIPTGKNEKLKNINKTIECVIDSASTEIEVLILADGWVPEGIDKRAKISSSSVNLGERGTTNRGFKEASGDYILRIDAHCDMSDDWDETLLKQYKENTISLCCLDALKEDTWASLGHNYTFVYVTPSCDEKWWGYYKEDNGLICEPSMSLTGCGWFCSKQFFLDHLQFDEDLSKWGCIGPELTAKIERANSFIMINKNVTCLHLFNTNPSGYSVKEVSRTRNQVLSRYAGFLYAAAKRFNAPGWEHITEDYILNYEKNFMFKTDVSKKENIEVKDTNGKVVKKIIKEYEPVPYEGSENPDIQEVGLRIATDACIKRIKIAELRKDDTWKFAVLDSKNEIDMWLFENE